MVAALVALGGCTQRRSATGASTSPPAAATTTPTATVAVTPTTVASPAPAPTQSATPRATKTTPSTAHPGSGTPPATPTPPPAPPPAGAAFVITQADTGKTYTLPSGSTAELHLATNFQWSAPKVTPAIVALTPEPVPSGAGYEGWQMTTTGHGTAVVESTGAPICPPGHMCAQFVILFRATVVVP